MSRRMRLAAWLAALLLAPCGAALAAAAPLPANAQHVSFPSLDGAGNAPVVLTGLWMPATAPAPVWASAAAAASAASAASAAAASVTVSTDAASVPPQSAPSAVAASHAAPAVALFHGCGGAFNRRGELTQRMRDYGKLFNEAGYGVLIVDSLTPRYEIEICTQRLGHRRVTQANRRLDALGALTYLASRADVDPQRIGIVGWSNGGSTVLAATNLRHRDVAESAARAAFAIAFYPGCEADLRRGYDAAAPLLMLLGGADDWTPPAPCRSLAGKAAGPKPEFVSYAGAYHDFDSDTPVRIRKDVPNGQSPGQGVHVGGNAAAWHASTERLLKFLADR